MHFLKLSGAWKNFFILVVPNFRDAPQLQTSSITTAFMHKLDRQLAKTLGSGYFAIDGILPLETILP